MSIKQETVEVRRCDLCVSTDAARSCDHCKKDACSGCGKIYKVLTEYWSTNPLTINLSSLGGPAIFNIFICHDCADNELPKVLLGFGFEQTERLKTGTLDR